MGILPIYLCKSFGVMNGRIHKYNNIYTITHIEYQKVPQPQAESGGQTPLEVRNRCYSMSVVPRKPTPGSPSRLPSYSMNCCGWLCEDQQHMGGAACGL